MSDSRWFIMHCLSYAQFIDPSSNDDVAPIVSFDTKPVLAFFDTYCTVT